MAPSIPEEEVWSLAIRRELPLQIYMIALYLPVRPEITSPPKLPRISWQPIVVFVLPCLQTPHQGFVGLVHVRSGFALAYRRAATLASAHVRQSRQRPRKAAYVFSGVYSCPYGQ